MSGARSIRVCLLLAVACCALLGAGLCSQVLAAQSARLEAAFSPERLGAPTTIYFGFRISTIPPAAPAPLTNVGVLLPDEMGIATSGLGLENCVLSRLEELGPRGCPADSVMGRGTATAEIPIGGETVVESAQIEVFSAPVRDGRLTLMVYANALTPVYAQLVFPATVDPAPAPYGEDVDTNVPLVPTVPDGPNVAVTRFHMALGAAASGPDHFVYYRIERHRRVAYSPAGLLLPPACPRGGFPFEARFSFQGQPPTTARVMIPCPPRGAPRRREI
jgi:hypothetical protein